MTTAWVRTVVGMVVASSLAALAGAAEPPAPPPAQPAAPPASQPAVQGSVEDAMWALTIEGYFPGQTRSGGPKNLNIYAVRRNGKWVSALGTATIQGRAVWNTALQVVDLSGVTYADGKFSGQAKITLIPDPWVPKDQKSRTGTITLQGAVSPDTSGKALGFIGGTWTSQIDGDPAELKAAELESGRSGKIMGAIGPNQAQDISDTSYDLAFYQLLPGKTTEEFQRRRAYQMGVKDGKAVSARLGAMDIKHAVSGLVEVETPSTMAITNDTLEGEIRFYADTLSGDRAEFDMKIKGVRVANWLVGTWSGKVTTEDGRVEERSGFFRGDSRGKAYVADAVAPDTRPWFVEVPNFKPVAPGEHPRLFFRKSDVAELRRRAATPDGQKLVARLRQLLNGSDGETLPTRYNPAKVAYNGDKSKGGTGESWKSQPGDYSISHAAGYGFLYQLTGDKKYADLAKQCVEKAWEGQRNFDDRYAWVAPGGELRAGPSLGWYAVAYDLCYDAWPEDFRQKVALAIQNYTDEKGGEWNNPEGITLEKMVLQPRQGPGSNHFGAVTGGSGLAVLAIKGDPGTDDKLLTKYLTVLERQVVKHLQSGWGDGGYYYEGWGASRVGTQGGFLCFLQALRTATGRDYVNGPRPNASFITMVPRALMVLGGKQAYFPYRSNMGPTYGNPEIGSVEQNAGFSHGGMFSEGFGAIAEAHKPGFLWVYNNLFDPDNRLGFDTASGYPHRPMLALVNWPTFAGVTPKNPAEALPLVTRDSVYDYFVFRNGFKDAASDVVTTVLVKQPSGTKPRDIMVWGLGGLRLNMGEPKLGVKVTYFAPGKDGSGVLTAGDFRMAVDYSKVSGADALVITVGNTPKALDAKVGPTAKLQEVTLGDQKLNVLTLKADGAHPEPKVEGNKVRIGDQIVTLENGNLVLGTFTPAPTTSPWPAPVK